MDLLCFEKRPAYRPHPSTHDSPYHIYRKELSRDLDTQTRTVIAWLPLCWNKSAAAWGNTRSSRSRWGSSWPGWVPRSPRTGGRRGCTGSLRHRDEPTPLHSQQSSPGWPHFPVEGCCCPVWSCLQVPPLTFEGRRLSSLCGCETDETLPNIFEERATELLWSGIVPNPILYPCIHKNGWLGRTRDSYSMHIPN